MDALATFLQQSITFFAILDPIGISAIALSILSPNITKTQINKVAYKATITIIIAFFVVLISGEMLLKLFGIDENSLLSQHTKTSRDQLGCRTLPGLSYSQVLLTFG